MAKGVGQEGYFWDTSPWVMSNNSIDGFEEAGGEKRYPGDKNSGDISMPKNNRLEDILDGSSGGDKEVAAIIVGGGSNNNNVDTFEIKKEIKVEDDIKASPQNRKAKRELAPSDHDLHILTERERRKKMRNMFHQLHALMPQLPHKADKSAVVDEAVTYIQTLQETLKRLETKKLEMLYGPSTKTTSAFLIQPESLSINNTRESFLADQGSSTGNNVGEASSSSLSFPLSSPIKFQTWVSSNVTLNVCGKDAQISIFSARKPELLTAICFVLEKHKLEIVSAEIFSKESNRMFMIHAQANASDKFMEKFHCDEIYKQAASEITHLVNS